jgi:hypothetical protein
VLLRFGRGLLVVQLPDLRQSWVSVYLARKLREPARLSAWPLELGVIEMFRTREAEEVIHLY